jgi:hypothetical protein
VKQLQCYLGLRANEQLNLPGQPAGVGEKQQSITLAFELLHLPGKPAGVGEKQQSITLAFELLHLPGKPAGVEPQFLDLALPSRPLASHSAVESQQDLT